MGTPKYAQQGTKFTPREGFEDGGKEFEINRRASKVGARRSPGVERVSRLEESLYWLFSAAMLSYLLLQIIGR
jgi:hypothetical protein